MRFQFHIHITDADYFDYNQFCMLRSPFGRKQLTALRTVIAVIISGAILILFIGGGFTPDSLISVIPLLILLAVSELFITRFFSFILKLQMKGLKKSGKMSYSPVSVIEFYDDRLVEITQEQKIEQKYTAIERISVVDNRIIYIHVNHIMAYLLPLTCFESTEQYNDFLVFIKGKCNQIDIY